jgi:hypothetical protein
MPVLNGKGAPRSPLNGMHFRTSLRNWLNAVSPLIANSRSSRSNSTLKTEARLTIDFSASRLPQGRQVEYVIGDQVPATPRP